jgi:hypothetical protein
MFKILLLNFSALLLLSCSEPKFSMAGKFDPNSNSSDQKPAQDSDPFLPKDDKEDSSKPMNVIVINSDTQDVIDSGTKTKLVGVGYAAGNFDDWNDGAICFNTTDADISVLNHKIVANKDVELNVKLFADMLPLPTLEVYKIVPNGDQILLISKNLAQGGRHEQTIFLKKGELLYTKMVLNGSTAYEQNSTKYTRVMTNNCDDYPDE